MIAAGVTIVFGVMRVVNFASGAFLVVGMYMTWLAYSVTGANAYAVLPFTVIAMALIALVCFFLALKPVLNREGNAPLIVTVGLSFFLQNIMLMIFGSTPLSIQSDLKNSSVSIGEYTIGIPRLIAFIAAVIFLIIITVLINKTSFGRAMRATSENVKTAGMLGINTNRVFALAWTIGIVLAGISGLLLTPIYYTDVTVGGLFRTTALIAVVLGGLGSIKGAFLSGLLLGVVEALVSSFISSDLGPAGVFVVFLLLLNFKPQGLFGKGDRVA